MKKFCLLGVFIVFVNLCFAGGRQDEVDVAQWPSGPVTVVCPWAVGGVVDIVNRNLAAYGEEALGQPIIATNDFLRDGAMSISSEFLHPVSSMLGGSGNIALTNYLKNEPNSLNLIIGSENAFAVSPNLPGVQEPPFSYDDFEPIINLCSAIFVLTADSALHITNLDSLTAYGQGRVLSVAVGGSTSIEYFMVKMLLEELGLGFEVIAYNGANVALEALMRGEVHLAVSHQSQARAGVESGCITPVVLFDKKGADDGVFAGTRGVGEYGYTSYCLNRSFLMARKGTDPAVIQKVYDAYAQILAKDEVRDLFRTMMIEVEPLDGAGINQHLAEVANMVKQHL